MENSVDFPTQAEIDRIMAEANKMRAEAFRNSCVALFHLPAKLIGGAAKLVRIPRTNFAD